MAADPLDPQGAALAPPADLPADPGKATAVLYKRHGTTVFRYAWHMLGKKEDAEDATQATFLSAHSAMTEGTIVREPRAWIMRIARNECLQRIQATMRIPLAVAFEEAVAAPAIQPSVERQAELRWDMTEAKRVLGELPVAQREAFVLREWCGLSPVEVGIALERSVASTDALIHRARKDLIKGVGEREGAAGCAATRQQIETDTLDRKGRAHLVRCSHCRKARAALRPAVEANARGLVPPASIADALGAAIPGFAISGSALAAGGGAVSLLAKLAGAPVAAKLGATAIATVAVAGGAVGVQHVAHVDRPATASAAVVEQAPGTSESDDTAPAATPRAAAPVALTLPRTVSDDAAKDRGGKGSGKDDHSGKGSGKDDSDKDGSGKGSGKDDSDKGDDDSGRGSGDDGSGRGSGDDGSGSGKDDSDKGSGKDDSDKGSGKDDSDKGSGKDDSDKGSGKDDSAEDDKPADTQDDGAADQVDDGGGDGGGGRTEPSGGGGGGGGGGGDDAAKDDKPEDG